jgi:hypothetical protein
MNRSKRILWGALAALVVTILAGSLGPSAMAQVRAALVRNVDTPALQPFQATLGINFAFINEQRLVTTVPAGKRLVIDHISYNATMPVGTQLIFGALRTGEFGTLRQFFEIHPPHISASASFILHDGSGPARVYFEAGEEVWVSTSTSSGAANRSMTVVISGYFITV